MAATVEDIRKKVHLEEFNISHTASSSFPRSYPGFDDAWNFNNFKKNFKVDVVSLNDKEMEFDMVGIDASIANAFRRILIAEVPSMAIDKVFIFNNSSIIQDEVLAHRLGLIPIFADPRLFNYPQSPVEGRELSDEEQLRTEPDVHLVFELKVKCTRNPDAPKDCANSEIMYLNNKVTTKDIKWIPIGDQAEQFGADGIRPVFDDILIAKLRPGHEIDLRMHCVKGVGCDHAKFSPVATASYRLLPEITLLRPITGDLTERLIKCFSKGVIKTKTKNGVLKAYVADARKDTGMREIYRDEELRDKVKLEKVRDHFIFSIESTGALPPEQLVEEAIKILHAKCQIYIDKLQSFT